MCKIQIDNDLNFPPLFHHKILANMYEASYFASVSMYERALFMKLYFTALELIC